MSIHLEESEDGKRGTPLRLFGIVLTFITTTLTVFTVLEGAVTAFAAAADFITFPSLVVYQEQLPHGSGNESMSWLQKIPIWMITRAKLPPI